MSVASRDEVSLRDMLRFSESRRNSLKSIPWKFIIGQRNVLAHMYGNVENFQIYRTAKEDVPELMSLLRGALR